MNKAPEGRHAPRAHVAALRLGLCCAALCVCLLLILVDFVSAQDTVYLLPTEASRAGTRVTGTITEFTGRELLIRTASGREQMIPAARVDDFATEYTQQQVDADLRFAENKFATAEAQYREALTAESRQWVRRQIMAQIVWCLRNQGRHADAAKTFLLIVENDPTTQFFDAMPLTWLRTDLDLAAERQADTWLRDDRDPAAQLIAASWLVSGQAAARGEALRALEDLTHARDLRIAQLAEMQLWRTQIVTTTARDIPRLHSAVNRLPEPLRAGGYYLLGQAYARNNQHQQAALAHMRVPVLYPNERALSAEALLAAADALTNSNRADEARNCLRELLTKHPGSTAAAAAKSQLESTKQGG